MPGNKPYGPIPHFLPGHQLSCVLLRNFDVGHVCSRFDTALEHTRNRRVGPCPVYFPYFCFSARGQMQKLPSVAE
jgi:hypothetical protein